jgi:hypothetical protein
MARNFEVTATPPSTDCTKQDLVDAMEQMNPLAAVVDLATLEVIAGKIQAMLNVPRWQKVGDALDYADFSDASIQKSVKLMTLSAKGVIHAVKIKHSTAFAGGAVSSVRLSVGVTTNMTKYAAAHDAMVAVSDTAFTLASETKGETHESAGTDIYVTADAQGANLDALTAGVVDVWVMHSATL